MLAMKTYCLTCSLFASLLIVRVNRTGVAFKTCFYRVRFVTSILIGRSDNIYIYNQMTSRIVITHPKLYNLLEFHFSLWVLSINTLPLTICQKQ